MQILPTSRAGRFRLAILLLALFFIPATLTYFICMPGQSGEGSTEPLTAQQDEALSRMQLHTVKLSRGIGGRRTRLPKSLLATEHYIQAIWEDQGYEVRRQTYQAHGGDVHNLEIEIEGKSKPQEIFIVGAHYDSPHGSPGADDNASGCMALLALAEALVEYGPMRRSVLLLWLTAEEDGLRGSRAFVQQPTLHPSQRAICNINIDMLGRNAPESLFLSPSPGHLRFSGLSRLAHGLAAAEGFERLGSADEYWQRADSYNFSEAMHLPVVFLFSGLHDDYHLHTDTSDKVDFHKLRRATRLVFRLVERLQADSLKL